MKFPLVSRAAVYRRFGVPSEVLRVEDMMINSPTTKEVVVRFLASPINPSDLNTIEGVYPIKPSEFPAVGGAEGVGEVIATGGDTSLEVGQWVVPAKMGYGTWRTYGVGMEDDWIPVRKDAGVIAAATVRVNPSTAYRLLKDYTQTGSVVIQNAANSAVGEALIQLANRWGIQTVNVVRKRATQEEQKQLEDRLLRLGGNIVITEEDASNSKMMSDILQDKGLRRPNVAFNAVGGMSCLSLVKNLDYGGKLITYGGMSMKPVMLPTSSLIFKDISAHGFWLTRWAQEASLEERARMIDELLLIWSEGKLSQSIEEVGFSEFEYGIIRGRQGYRNGKVLFRF